MRAYFAYLCWAVLTSSVLLCSGGPLHNVDAEDDHEHQHHLHKRAAPTLMERSGCSPGDVWPPTRVNTTQRLKAMRDAMSTLNIDAFIVFSGDAHSSEYPADSDKRRGFISGFTGSAGWAVVTMNKAALWTDGRYFLEAEDALDCNWLFMRSGQPGVPGYVTWLTSELTAGQTVGADPFLVTNRAWQSLESAFSAANITVSSVTSNPVDAAWTDQPVPPNTTINALALEYAGRSWQDKVGDVHTAMENKGITGATVVTSLDEIAWLFNLRASDIDYNPFFIAYAIVEYYGNSHANNRVRLYIYDKLRRLTVTPSDPATKDKLHVHLNTGENGTCVGRTGMCVEVHDYDSNQVVSDIMAVAQNNHSSKLWVTYSCNFAIFNAIPEGQRLQDKSYIALAKAQKNPTERRGMQLCYNRDSAVLVEFLAEIERDVKQGTREWSEVTSAAKLKEMREAADNNRGLSFSSIAGSGPNGAIIHYRPATETDRKLTTDEMFLLDSGGQYLECTTDVTRTMHYGTPTAFMKEAYTRVLMGSIDLANVVWPVGLLGREIDALTRAPLWAAGLDYNHGTGHGIGAYLSVHEGPGSISLSRSTNPSEETLHPYQYFSDEPGYYQDGEFGIRLETIVMIEPTNTTHGHRFENTQFLRWTPITLVPFERNLIDYNMLSKKQIDWLNDYHQRTLSTIEPLLTSDLAKSWLRERTRPHVLVTGAASPQISFSFHLFFLTLVAALAFWV